MIRLRGAASLVALLGLLHACGGDTSPSPGDVRDAAGATRDAARDTPPDTSPDAAPRVDAWVDATSDAIRDAGSDAVLDVAPDAPADAVADVTLPPPPACQGENLLVTREGTNGDVSFRLDRCLPPICGGGCPVYSPQLTVVTPGRTWIALPADITYNQTHHNWQDSLSALLPDARITWRVEFDFDEGLVERHFVAVETLDGAPVLPETLFSIAPY